MEGICSEIPLAEVTKGLEDLKVSLYLNKGFLIERTKSTIVIWWILIPVLVLTWCHWAEADC